MGRHIAFVTVPVLIIAVTFLTACDIPFIASSAPTPTTIPLPTVPAMPSPTGAPQTSPTETPTLVVAEETEPSPTATPTPTPTLPLSGEMILQEDFKNNAGGWDLAPSQQSRREIKDGKLQIAIPVKGWMAWSNPGGSFSDFKLEVDVTLVEDPADGSCGVLFRYQNPDNFYMLDISGDGYYSVNKLLSGVWQELITPTQSAAIEKRGQTNRLGIVAIGQEIEFYANDKLLGEVRDGSFAGGDVALYASTYEKAGLQVAFDNLTVYGQGTLAPAPKQAATRPAAPPQAAPGGVDQEIVTEQVDKGFEYYADGAYDQALAEFKAALSGDPDNARAHYGIGLVYDRQDKRREAIDEYLLAVSADPKLAGAYKGLGIDYHSIGEIDKAIEMLETYLELQPQAEDRAEVEEMASKLKQGIPVAPVGKGLVVVHNYTYREASFTIAGEQYPVPGADSVEGGGEISIALYPGQYTFSANQPERELVHDDLTLEVGDVVNIPLH
jgi:tetratricopeptide (TPR) repeat protein